MIAGIDTPGRPAARRERPSITEQGQALWQLRETATASVGNGEVSLSGACLEGIFGLMCLDASSTGAGPWQARATLAGLDVDIRVRRDQRVDLLAVENLVFEQPGGFVHARVPFIPFLLARLAPDPGHLLGEEPVREDDQEEPPGAQHPGHLLEVADDRFGDGGSPVPEPRGDQARHLVGDAAVAGQAFEADAVGLDRQRALVQERQRLERRLAGVYNCDSPAGETTMGGLLEDCRTVVTSDARFTWCDADFLAEQGVTPWTDMPVWVPARGEYQGWGQVSTARAVAAMKKDLVAQKAELELLYDIEDRGRGEGSLRDELKAVMENHCSVFRNEEVLSEGVAKVELLAERFKHARIDDHSSVFNTARVEALELENLFAAALATIHSALERKESRGLHYNINHLEKDDIHWKQDTLIRKFF